MSTQVYSQNSHQVKRDTVGIIRERGPLGWIVSGLIVIFLLLCGFAALTCRFELSPFRIVCPAPPSTETPIITITPTPTSTLTGTAITDTPTPTGTAFTDTPTPTGTTITDTPTPTPTVSCTALTASPLAKEAAIQLAMSVGDHFFRNYGVRINASEAVPFNEICFGTDSSQLLGMIAPAIDGNQRYKDREVEGIFNINDSRFEINTVIVLNKGTTQDSILPLGSYMLACNHQLLNDCLAISMQGEEFHINPESVSITMIDPEVSPPTVAYEKENPIRKCFKVLRRKVCIRVFR